MIKVESYGIVPFLQEQNIWKVLLILHREGNHWGFPKGRAEPDETPFEAAARELKEETGLIVQQRLRQDPLIEQYQFRRKHQLILKIVHYFPALVTGSLHLQEAEIREAKWCTILEALELLTFKEARHILQEFVRDLKIST